MWNYLLKAAIIEYFFGNWRLLCKKVFVTIGFEKKILFKLTHVVSTSEILRLETFHHDRNLTFHSSTCLKTTRAITKSAKNTCKWHSGEAGSINDLWWFKTIDLINFAAIKKTTPQHLLSLASIFAIPPQFSPSMTVLWKSIAKLCTALHSCIIRNNRRKSI